MTHRLLVLSIYLIGSVFVGLTVLIVLNKAYRESRTRWHLVRRWKLEPKVLAWVHGNEPSIRQFLPAPLGRVDRAVIEDILLGHVQRVKGIEQKRLRKAIDELGYVDRYLEQLGGRRWWYRAQAAERIGVAGSTRATPRLVAALEDEVPEVRIRAATALGLVGGRVAIRPLVRALSEPDRWSTIRMADILTQMGTEAVDELVDEFPKLNLSAKVAALDILGRARSLHVSKWLRERLGDPEPDVRARAAHAVGAIGDIDAGPLLRRALRDKEWPVRAMAAKALGKTRQLEAIPDLCEAMRDREWWVRSNAARALRACGPGGRDALVWMLDDQDNFARHQAVLMLQEDGMLDEKVALLSRPDPAERTAAEMFVRRFVQAGQIGRLNELSVTHRDPEVRRTLRRELDVVARPEAS